MPHLMPHLMPQSLSRLVTRRVASLLLAAAGMLEREAKREKNLEKRAIELARRARATEQEAKTAEKSSTGKDEKMEEILRKVDAEFLAMIKDAEEEETKGADDDVRK
jgi:dynein intermediate chain 2